MLIRRPIINLFWSNCFGEATQSLPPTSFETICTKLEKNLYSSYEEWISEVHRLFDFYINNNSNQVIHYSAKQLKSEFDELTSKFASNTSIRLDKLKQIQTELNDLISKYANEMNQMKEDIHPAAEIFNMPLNSIEDPIKVIKRNISLFKSPEMILRITAILYKIQPETIVINGEQIRIEFALMRPETINDLLKYTIFLLRLIASGNLDPYSCNENTKMIDSYLIPKQK